MHILKVVVCFITHSCFGTLITSLWNSHPACNYYVDCKDRRWNLCKTLKNIVRLFSPSIPTLIRKFYLFLNCFIKCITSSLIYLKFCHLFKSSLEIIFWLQMKKKIYVIKLTYCRERAWVSTRDVKQQNMEVPSENYPYYLSILQGDRNYGNQSHCVMLSYMDILQKMQPLLYSLTWKHSLCYSTGNGPFSHSLHWGIWFFIHL